MDYNKKCVNCIGSISCYDTRKGKILQGIYRNFLNIPEIDLIIKDNLISRKDEITDLENSINKIEKGMENSKLTYVEYKKLKNITDEMDNKIKKFKSLSLEDYIEKSEKIIEKYNSINCKENKSFVDKKSETFLSDFDIKILLIEEYISIISKYIETRIIRDNNLDDNICFFCNEVTTFETNNTGMSFCSKCFSEKQIITKIPFLKDVDVQDNGKFYVREEDNFYKAILRLQGKQSNLSEKVITDVKDYLISKKIDLNKIINSPVDQRGKKKGTSKNLLMEALKETQNEFNYKDFNLIAHYVWGWKLIDLSDHEEIILQDYDKTQKFYEEVKGDRKTGLNSDIRLFLHMRSRNLSPDSEDFRIADTPDIIDIQVQIFNQMALKAGIPTVNFKID